MTSKRKRTDTDTLGVLADVVRRLPVVKADSIAAAALAEDVRRWISDDSSLGANDVPTEDYHRAGVRLWNMVLRLEREVSSTPEYQQLLVHCRVLALCVLDSAFAETLCSGPEDKSRCIYLLEIALRAARACFVLSERKGANGNDSELCRLVLDKAAKYQQSLGERLTGEETDGDGDGTKRHKATVHRLNMKRIVLELGQLWTESRLDDADKLFLETFTRNPIHSFGLDTDTHEELTVTLFHIGKSLLAEKSFAGAVTWLERTLDCFPPEYAKDSKYCDVMVGDKMGDSTNLRNIAMHALAFAALGLQTRAGLERAQDLVHKLSMLPEGLRDRRVQILQLEVYDSPLADSFAANDYAAALSQMIKSFDWTLEEYSMLHHHIQKLHSKSPGLGCGILDEWMMALRNGDGAGSGANTEWMEKLVITRVWLLAHQRETKQEFDTAQTVLSKVRMPIGADAAAAAQTLMWKRIEQGYQEKQYATAIRWCQLALSHIFEAGGRSNRPLIERKLILCAVESGDLQAAHSAYANMSEATRDEPMTKYLMYKLAIKLGDLDMAAECLRCIAMSTGERELLHACVLYARHAKRRVFVAQALKKLADSINRSNSHDLGEGDLKDTPVHAPALFRCTILMLRDIVDGVDGVDGGARGDAKNDDQNDESSADRDDSNSDNTRHVEHAIRDLTSVFKGVVDAVGIDRDYHALDKDRLFTTEELEWFCRAAYNIGLKHSGTWDLRHTVAILESCVTISHFLPSDGQGNHASAKNIAAKRLTSRFLIASALAALSRSAASSPTVPSDSVQDQMLKDSQAMRKHILAFCSELKHLDPARGNAAITKAYAGKLSVLLAFDFEGAIRLCDWDELGIICERAAACDNPDTLRVLGDTLLRAQATVPSNKFVSTMRLIVKKLQAASNFGNDKLIRYYRCLYQAALYRDNDAAFAVLEEVGRLVGVALRGPPDLGDSQAPVHDEWAEELQYMASIAFNEGIDWFAGGGEEQARQWAAAAMRLAEMCGDGGKLKGMMASRFALLGMGELGTQPSVETEAGRQTEATDIGFAAASASPPVVEMVPE